MIIQSVFPEILPAQTLKLPPARRAGRGQSLVRKDLLMHQDEFTFPQGAWAEFCSRQGLSGLNFKKLKCEGNYLSRAKEQIQAIEWLLKNNKSINLISAPTGSGKTLIELIAALADRRINKSRQPGISIIVTPRINLTYQHALHEAVEVIADPSIPVIAVSSGNKASRKKDYKSIARAGRGIIIITPETLLKELKRKDSFIATAQILSLTFDEAHHISEGQDIELGKSPYAKIFSKVVEGNPGIPLRLFSATHFTSLQQGQNLIKFFSTVCPGRKAALHILDLPAPNLTLRKIKLEQVPDYYRLRKVLDQAVAELIKDLSVNKNQIRKMLESIAENPSDTNLSKRYFNFIHDQDYEFERRGALYSAPALIGILRHAIQLLNEPAVCMSLIFTLAVFAFQNQHYFPRTFGKNFEAKSLFNEDSKTYKERIHFARKFLKKMFIGDTASLREAFIIMALKYYPEDILQRNDEASPIANNSSINKLRYVLENEADLQVLSDMEEMIAKRAFRDSARVRVLLDNLRETERELIYYNRVDLAEAVVKIIKKVSGKDMAVAYTSKQNEKESEESLAKILTPESGVTKLVMTSKAGEGKNIPKARRLYVCSVPNTALELVQLYGRVGRDGQPGEVVLLLTAQEMKSLERLEQDAAGIIPAFKALKLKCG